MLLNMVMFKVTICDIGKMNVNMTDKIEKRRQPLQCRTMARTTTTMWTARWCSILSMYLSVRFSLRRATTSGIHLISSMRRNYSYRKKSKKITKVRIKMNNVWYIYCGGVYFLLVVHLFSFS